MWDACCSASTPEHLERRVLGVGRGGERTRINIAPRQSLEQPEVLPSAGALAVTMLEDELVTIGEQQSSAHVVPNVAALIVKIASWHMSEVGVAQGMWTALGKAKVRAEVGNKSEVRELICCWRRECVHKRMVRNHWSRIGCGNEKLVMRAEPR